MKITTKLAIALLLSVPVYGQYAASTSGSSTANATIDSKPAFQTVSGAPSSLNGTLGKDFATDTSAAALYFCSATGTPCTWKQIIDASTSQTMSNKTFVAPVLGAATATSLLATGIVDGKAAITITTGTTATLGAGTYGSGYTFNQEATAGTGVTYTLPATVTGAQYCVKNSGTTGVVNIGVLTVYPPASSFVIVDGVVNTVGGGGTHGVASGGAAGDAACFVAIDSTHWSVFVGKGTWTAN